MATKTAFINGFYKRAVSASEFKASAADRSGAIDVGGTSRPSPGQQPRPQPAPQPQPKKPLSLPGKVAPKPGVQGPPRPTLGQKVSNLKAKGVQAVQKGIQRYKTVKGSRSFKAKRGLGIALAGTAAIAKGVQKLTSNPEKENLIKRGSAFWGGFDKQAFGNASKAGGMMSGMFGSDKPKAPAAAAPPPNVGRIKGTDANAAAMQGFRNKGLNAFKSKITNLFN